MIIISRKLVYAIVTVIFFGIGFFSVRYLSRPRIRLGGRYLTVNYRAKINPKKNYHLRLWDYGWPGPDEGAWYRNFMEAAVRDFEKENSNIRVELSLLDFSEGPAIFAEALAAGRAPDVYCTAYEIPEFSYEWQIPAGIFLKPEESAVYYPRLRKLVTMDNYLLMLPRWSVPGIWVGNRSLMEKEGLSVEQIQKVGWSWRDLSGIGKPTKPVCIGNLSANGFLPQLLSIYPEKSESNIRHLGEILNLIKGPASRGYDYEGNMFQLFLSGRVMFIGGVRPKIYEFLNEKAGRMKTGWEPVILPIPADVPRLVLPVENSVIGVYRHQKTGGDDQVAAAVKLAYFISTYQQIDPWRRLNVIPAVPDLARKWAADFGADPALRLVEWFNEAELHNIKVFPGYQTAVYPGLKNFYSGKSDLDEMERIIQELLAIK